MILNVGMELLTIKDTIGGDVMRNRQRKKKYKEQLFNRIETVRMHPTEAIVLFYRLEQCTTKELYYQTTMLKKKFPKHHLLVLPEYYSLESCSKDVLENYISAISDVIDKL